MYILFDFVNILHKMTNRSSSKQHCFVGKDFPKAKKSKKRNKFKARMRREEAAKAKSE